MAEVDALVVLERVHVRELRRREVVVVGGGVWVGVERTVGLAVPHVDVRPGRRVEDPQSPLRSVQVPGVVILRDELDDELLPLREVGEESAGEGSARDRRHEDRAVPLLRRPGGREKSVHECLAPALVLLGRHQPEDGRADLPATEALLCYPNHGIS